MIAPKVLATTILVFGLTGCGGSGDANPPNDQSGDLQSTSVPTTPTSTLAPDSTTTTTSTTTSTTIATTTVAETTTTLRATVEGLESGLFCRDVNSKGFGYSDAVAYWVREGEPDRMDADHNGIPCETVYPESDVLAFWGDALPTSTVPSARRYFRPHEPWEYPDSVPWGSDTYGSGCSPGTTALPDGMWFGFLVGYGPSEIGFDLACIHVPGPDDEGGAAIRNDNPRIRTIPIDPTISVHYVVGGWVNGIETYERWVDRGCYDLTCPVWLYVNDGAVTAIAEHFLTG